MLVSLKGFIDELKQGCGTYGQGVIYDTPPVFAWPVSSGWFYILNGLWGVCVGGEVK